MNTSIENNLTQEDIKKAKRFYKWLWWSPILLIPTIIFFNILAYLGIYFFYDEPVVITIAALWHLVFLLSPAIRYQKSFVRWHARQALLIALFFTFLQYFNFEFDEGFLILVYVIHFFITLWGFNQITRDEIKLMEWFGKKEQFLSKSNIQQETTLSNPKTISEPNIEIIKLEFLINETVNWKVAKKVRQPYIDKLEILKEKYFPKLVAPEPMLPPITIPKTTKPTSKPVAKSVAKPKPKPIPRPPKEKIPFDQWLLSERNIKFMLYSGAALLIIAGLVWIGVRWNNFPGFVKFAITFFITGLTYLGGYLIYQRPRLKFGGNALLGIASGFLVMNFIVLQLYVFGPEGLDPIIMWLIASPICMGIYIVTAFWTKSEFFIYLGITSLASILVASLFLVHADLFVYFLGISILLLALNWGSFAIKGTKWKSFTHSPLKWVSQIGMPVFLIATVFSLLFYLDLQKLTNNFNLFSSIGSRWLAIITLGTGVIFYTYLDFRDKSQLARWVTSILFTITLGFIMTVLNLTESQFGTTFIIQAFAYLGIGKWLSGYQSRKYGGWPYYLLAYFLAAALTFYAIENINLLIYVLVADVLILGAASYIHIPLRKLLYYVAVWLFMLPVYLYVDQANEVFHTEGLLMGILGLNYAAAGYLIGRIKLQNGMPFLSASAFLSVATLFMTWGDPTSATIVLAFDAILYLIAATWIGLPWLLLPSLTALSLVIIHITSGTSAFIISMAVLGNIIALGGYALKRLKIKTWSWPLYLVGAVDIAIAYYLSFTFGDNFLIISLSAELVILLFTMAMLEKDFFQEKDYQPILAYIGIIILFVGHFFVLDSTLQDKFWSNWPPYTAALTAFFALISWLLRDNTFGKVFKTPFRISGLGLMVIPIIGVAFSGQESIIAITFGIATLVYLIEAARESLQIFAYIGISGVYITHFFVLSSLVGLSTFLDVWPIYTLLLTTFFVILYRVLNQYQIGKMFILPLKQAGLVLILLPTIYALINYSQFEQFMIATLLITALIYLTEAHRTKLIVFSYTGLIPIFILPYFILNVVMQARGVYDFYEESLLIIYSILPLLFVFLYRILERYKIGKIFILPLKQFGLILMALPILFSIFLYLFGLDAWLIILAFSIAAVMYLSEAAKINAPLFAYLGVVSIYIIHAIPLINNYSLHETWPVITVIFTALLSSIYWILDRFSFWKVFKTPFKYFGMGLMFIPIIGSLNNGIVLQITIVIAIATAAYLVEAFRKRETLFTYISTAGIYLLHYLLIVIFYPSSYYRIWPPITAAFTALMAAVYWQLYTRKIGKTFQLPYQFTGLILMAIPLVFTLNNFNEWNTVIVWIIASVVYFIEARIKRKLILSYLAVAIVITTIWSILATLNITELQAYVFPLGIALVGTGWYQRKKVNDQFYQPITIIGLGIFFISALYQSLPTSGWVYALLLTIESGAAIYWGIRQKSRGYVQFGGLALITNAVIQFGPAFAALDRWIQMGAIGSILLILGLVALFKREEVLETRQKATKEWRSWNS